MAGSIFISYRRDDTAAEAGAIFHAIRDKLGQESVFMDTSSISAGAEWPNEIRSALEAARLVIVVIGAQWVRSSDEWGRRRIDQDGDWVRREVETATNSSALIIPVLVNGAKLPPQNVLPDVLRPLVQRQAIELRRDYWDHDILLLLAQLDIAPPTSSPATVKDIDPYPKRPPEAPDPLDEEKVGRILTNELPDWRQKVSPLPGSSDRVRVELVRQFKFRTFQDAVHFMAQVAPGCDIAMHHPRWENIWKTLTVALSTWDHGLHRVTDRDVMLAKYFDRAFKEYKGPGGES